VFPDIEVNRSHIVFRFSGVRPLPRHDDEAPGFVSRDYRIESSPLGSRPGTLLSLVGGKWTTFRALAEHLSGDILALLGQPRVVSTVGLAIGGGKGFPATPAALTVWLAAHGDEVGRARAQQLLTRYGTRAAAIIDVLTEQPDAPLEHNALYSRREIEYLAREESVTHLIDLLLRRTSLAFVGGLSVPLLEELAGLLAPVLGWDAERTAAEIEQAVAELREVHGVDLAAADTVPSI
jgi:glycerol-3-phosphate dehydrogenase